MDHVSYRRLYSPDAVFIVSVTAFVARWLNRPATLREQSSASFRSKSLVKISLDDHVFSKLNSYYWLCSQEQEFRSSSFTRFFVINFCINKVLLTYLSRRVIRHETAFPRCTRVLKRHYVVRRIIRQVNGSFAKIGEAGGILVGSIEHIEIVENALSSQRIVDIYV